MGYWLVLDNECNARCQSTFISLKTCWICGPCVKYYWKYGQRNLFTSPLGISSNIPFNDTWRSDSREIGWEVIHVEIVGSDLGVMCNQVMFCEVVCKVCLTWLPMKSELFLDNFICNPKVLQFHGL